MSEPESPATRMIPEGLVRPPLRPHARRDFWLGLAVVYAACLGWNECRLWRPGALFDGSRQPQIAEARAWWNGRLELPERQHDTAVSDGLSYSHFPVMFTIIAAGLVPLFGGVPHGFLVAALAVPVPLLAYVLFRRLTASSWWGAAGAIGLVMGTSLWPVLDRTVRSASPYFVNHALATIGLLILLLEFSGRRRVWVAGLGLIIATMSRQMTVAFALPLAWLAWRGGSRDQRASRLGQLAFVGIVVAAVPLTMNTLKFGHPLTTGYSLIYTEREDDPFARDAKAHGLFSWHFVPRNLWHANLGFPKLHRIEVVGKAEYHLRPSFLGTGIWWTTPLLLWLFVDLRRILADPAARVLLVSSAAIYVALLFFHATGADQRGYNRFSLDYLPALLAIVAPRCFVGWRRWLSVGMIAWSVVYFCWLI